jgi:hypothetical protein
MVTPNLPMPPKALPSPTQNKIESDEVMGFGKK